MSTDNYQDFFGVSITDLVFDSTATVASASSVEPDHQSLLDSILEKHKGVFAPLPNGVPVRDVKHRINLEPGAKPVSQPTRRMSPAELKEVSKQLADFLEKGFIQPSNSPYGSPILFVRKSSGELRWCVEYMALNDQTIKDRYPIPRIEEMLDMLKGSQYFTKLDLNSGYHQLPMAPEDVSKTAFKTRYGQYEFKVLPFGLCNAPGTFQRAMDDMLRPHLDVFTTVYLDDILIFSNTFEEHMEHLDKVLTLLSEHKFHVKQKRCDFGLTRITFLGHVIDRDGIHMDPCKVEAVREWPTPNKVRKLRGFLLGLADYFRRFIQAFAAIASPLIELTKEDTPWQWTSEHQEAFNALKAAITTGPELAYPDYSKPFDIHVDASGFATGAVLQRDQGKGLQPIAYLSHRMSPAERNYPVHEQEMLAIVLALRAWRCYVEGTPFTVHTDHHTLQYLRKQPVLSRRQARWMDKLANFDATFKYVPGKKNRADALRRREDLSAAAPITFTTVQPDTDLLSEIQEAYTADSLVKVDQTRPAGKRQLLQQDGLWYSKQGLGLYLPESLQRRLIRECHSTALAGHLGVEKPLEQLRRRFWWPRMSASVAAFVKSCQPCQSSKPTNQKTAGLLQPLPPPDYPWQQLPMDLVTSLPTSTTSGYDAAVVFVDRLSKMTHFVAISKTIKAEELADVLLHSVVRLHGFPEAIISDRDPRFTSDFWQALFAKAGTSIKMSTPAHPQTDGQPERAIRTLLQMLRTCVNPSGDDWERHLPAIEFAYNNAQQSSTGLSPFEVVHGRRPRVPLDSTIAPSQRGIAPSPAASDYLGRIQELSDRVKAALQRSSARQKYHADKHRRESDIKAGDQVLVDSAHFGPRNYKLSPLYRGPFEVVERFGNTLLITLPRSLNQRHNRVNIDLARKFVPPAQPTEETEEEQFFDVERVLDMRKATTAPGRRGPKPREALCKCGG